jgi:hypothetical protein
MHEAAWVLGAGSGVGRGQAQCVWGLLWEREAHSRGLVLVGYSERVQMHRAAAATLGSTMAGLSG